MPGGMYKVVVKSAESGVVKTQDGLELINTSPLDLYAGDEVWTDGKYALTLCRRRGRNIFIHAGIIPTYTYTGLYDLNSRWISYEFKKSGAGNAFASDAQHFTIENDVLDLCISKKGKVNSIAGGVYIDKPSYNITSEYPYIKYMDLATGDRRNGGNMLIPRQTISKVESESGEIRAGDFLYSGNTEPIQKQESWHWNPSDHIEYTPIYRDSQKAEKKNIPLVVKRDGKIATYDLSTYVRLANFELEKAFSSIKSKAYIHSQKSGGYWAAGKPPNDYICGTYATVNSARIDADGNWTAVIRAWVQGVCFPYAFGNLDLASITNITNYSVHDIDKWTAMTDRPLYYGYDRTETNQSVSVDHTGLGYWTDANIIASVYILVTNGDPMVIKKDIVTPLPPALTMYDFAFDEGHGALNAGGFDLANYKKVYDYGGIWSQILENSIEKTGPSYAITLRAPMVYGLSYTYSSGGHRELTFDLNSGKLKVYSNGTHAKIYDTKGQLIYALPDAKTALGDRDGIGGIDAIQVKNGWLICDGYRRRKIYEITQKKNGERDAVNYRIAKMQSKGYLSSGEIK